MGHGGVVGKPTASCLGANPEVSWRCHVRKRREQPEGTRPLLETAQPWARPGRGEPKTMHLRWSPLCEATYLYQYSSWVVSGGKPNYRRSMEAGREAVLTAQDYFMVVGVAAAASSATGTPRYVLSE